MKLQTCALLLLFSGSLHSAELVLKNGKILKVDAEFGQASALAVDNGRIVAIGDESDVASHIESGTQVIDLEGRTVIPGLIDNHMHLVRAAQNWQQADPAGRRARLSGGTAANCGCRQKGQARSVVDRQWWLC